MGERATRIAQDAQVVECTIPKQRAHDPVTVRPIPAPIEGAVCLPCRQDENDSVVDDRKPG